MSHTRRCSLIAVFASLSNGRDWIRVDATNCEGA
jgi:hypothetical protein